MKSININNSFEGYNVVINLESHIDGNGTVIAPYQNNPDIDQIENIINEIDSFKEITKPAKKYKTNTKIISTKEDIEEHFKESEEKYFVKGFTDSKFSLLDLSFPMERAIAIEKETSNDLPKTLIKSVNTSTNEEEVVSVTPTTPTKEIRCGKKIEISGTNVTGMILSETENSVTYVLYLDTENPILYKESTSTDIDNNNNIATFKYMRNNIDDEVKPVLNYYSDTIDEPKVLSEVFIDRGVNNAFEPIKKLKNIKDLNELTKSGFGYYKINRKGYNFKDR